MFGFSVIGRTLPPCNASPPSDSQRALGKSLVPAREVAFHPAMAPHLEVTSAVSIPNADPIEIGGGEDTHRASRPFIVLSEGPSVGSGRQAAVHHARPDTDGEEDSAVPVQRVQYGGHDALPSTMAGGTGFRISNALPALQPDFELKFSR